MSREILLDYDGFKILLKNSNIPELVIKKIVGLIKHLICNGDLIKIVILISSDHLLKVEISPR
jgi:hypothetical protein